MTLVSIGDRASGFASRLQMSRTREDITRLSAEVSTGRKDSIVRETGGDLTRVAALERSIDIVTRYQVANSEAVLFLDTAQGALESVQAAVARASADLLLAGTAQDLSTLNTLARTAEQSLGQVISSLNTQVAGAALFSGAITGAAPLPGSESLTSVLAAEIATATTLEEVTAAISDWFDDPAGFDALFYRGSQTEGVVLTVAEGQQLDFATRANDQTFKDTLRTLVSAVLIADETTSGTQAEKAEALAVLGADLLGHEEGIIRIRGDVGVLQERAELAATGLRASTSAFEAALGDVYGVDPYDVATRLDASIQQLEALYAITSRLSELSLTRYLR